MDFLRYRRFACVRVALAILSLISFSASANFRANTSISGLSNPPNSTGIVFDGSLSSLCQSRLTAEQAFGRTWLRNPSNQGPSLTLSSNSGGFVCNLEDSRTTPATVVTVQYDSAAYRCGPEAAYITLPRAACTSCTSGYVLSGGSCRLPQACDDTTTVVSSGQLFNLGTSFSRCFNGCTIAATSEPVLCVSFGDNAVNPVCSSGDSGTQWRRTGAMCSANSASATAPALANGPNTATLGGGDSNCGTFNGEYMCLRNVPPAGCGVTPNGQFVCTQAAATPPRPNNGNPGVPARPDINAVTSGTTTGGSYQIYNSTTVAGSVNGGSTGGTGGATGGSSGGTGGGTLGGGTSGATGGSTGGVTGGTGGGTGGTSGGQIGEITARAYGDVPTFSQTTDDAIIRIRNAPVVVQTMAIAEAIPDSGACSFPGFTVLERFFSFEMFCDLLAEYEGTFRSICLFLWTMAAVFIFFRR